jgi:hypothetical protein
LTLFVDSIPAPDTTPFGLAHDGQHLWNVSLLGQEVYELDPANGSVLKSFPGPDQWCKGACFDGQYLWVTGNYQSRVYKVDTASGATVLSFYSPGSNPTGLAWDGTYLWCADINSDQSQPSRIFKLNPAGGQRLDSFEAPCRMVADMDWDGTRLWVCDMDNGIAYGMDPATGSVTRATGTPGPMPTGIAFSAGRLWNCDWTRRQVWSFHPDSGPAATVIDRPAQYDVLPTWRNPAIIGTVAGLGLDSFRVEYALDQTPPQWQPCGPWQHAAMYRDTLATWDVSGITQPGEYRVRIKACFGTAIDTGRVNLVAVDPQIAPNWPQTYANVSPVACADIAECSKFEVVAGTDHQNGFLNRLRAWCYDGRAVSGFPVPDIAVCQMPAALGDVNRTGRPEIGTGFDLNNSRVNLVYASGTVMNGWPQDGGRPGSLYYHGIPVLSDVDGDSVMEVFSGGGRLNGWDTAGGVLPGWPKAREFSSPAAADIDHDGLPELVAVAGESLFVFDGDGAVLSGWPVGLGGTGGSTFPVCGDVNGDDRLEIAVVVGTRLFCVDDSGQVLAGFPKTLSGSYASSPVLGDLDADGRPDIVVLSGNFPTNTIVNVVRYDGTSPAGWPKNIGGYVFRQFNAPVVGDVSGDGSPDVVLGLENCNDGYERLYAWSGSGSTLAGWPKLLRDIYGYGITGSPFLGDMNNDGMLECAVSSNAYWMYNTDIYVWNLDVPCLEQALDWPVFRHDPCLTACYDAPPRGVAGRSTPDAPRTTPVPTVVRGVLSLPRDMTEFGSANSGRVPRPELVDISGRKVMPLRPGSNDVSHLPPGVYFVRRIDPPRVEAPDSGGRGLRTRVVLAQ